MYDLMNGSKILDFMAENDFNNLYDFLLAAEEHDGNDMIEEIASKYGISKENIAIVYDVLKVNALGAGRFGNNLADMIADEFEKSSEKRLEDYVANSLGKFVKNMVDDLVSKPAEIVNEIRRRIAPMSIEEAYKGQLYKIVDDIIKFKYKMIMWMTFYALRPDQVETSKRLFLAIVSKDDTYNVEEKERLMELLSQYDFRKVVHFVNGELSGNSPEIEALRPYGRYIYSLIPEEDKLSELMKNWAINEITFETAVNIKNLCDEIKEKVKEVPSIPDATYEKPIVEEKEAEVRKMADLLRADPDLFEKVKELIGDKM